LKTTNQLVVLSGIIILLTAGTIAASNLVQPAKAAFGNEVIKPNVQAGNAGQRISEAARDSTGFGLADVRANGYKPSGTTSEDFNNGQGVAQIDPFPH